MRTGLLLACVAALGLFAGFSCTAHSDQADRTDSNAQSRNANSSGDEKKVTVSTGNGAVEVKSDDGNEKKVSVSTGDASVDVKTEDGKSVSISADGIKVSKSSDDSEKGEASSQEIVKIEGMNNHETYDCKGRSFNVAGKSNTVKLTGECQNLRVAGTSNEVDVEAVASIHVSGIENQVTWERGVNNKPPSISKSGINNSVSKKGQ
jgi:hypothetical protein